MAAMDIHSFPTRRSSDLYGDILWDPDRPNTTWCARSFSGVWINNTRKDTGDDRGKGYSGQ